MMKDQLDATDLRILNELTQNARIPYSQLAEKLRISNSLVHQRMRKMKDLGFIDRPVLKIHPEKLGYDTCAFTQIIIKEARLLYQVVDKLRDIPEIVECVNIAGRYAIIVKIFTQNNTALRDVVYDKIQSIDGVEGTNTVVAFETAFNREIPIPLD